MCLLFFAEAEYFACVLIVGMVARSKIAKYPFYRFRVGVRADFQDFVIVGEHKEASITTGVNIRGFAAFPQDRIEVPPRRRRRNDDRRRQARLGASSGSQYRVKKSFCL